MLFPHVADKFNLIYGRGLLPELTGKLDNYLIVADEFVYNTYKDQIKNKYQLYFVSDVEVNTLDAAIKKLDVSNITTVLGLGGGKAVDAGKYMAEKMGKTVHNFPTVLSVNAAFCYKSAMRVDSVVTYMGRIFPEAIYIDYDIIQSAPKYLNVAGAADLMSCLTGTYDWKINSLITKSHKFSQEVYDGAQNLLGLLAENVDNIKECNDDGIYFMCEAFRWIAENSAILNHTMWESASEHQTFDNLERIAGHGFLHGQIIALTTYFMSLLQENQHERVLSMVKRFGIDVSLTALGLTEDQLREGFKTLKWFAEEEKLRYTIIMAKPITDEWIDMAVAKYKKDFDIK